MEQDQPNQPSERWLRNREKQFQAIFNQALDAIVILDDYGRLISVNAAACQLLLITAEELVSHSVADFLESEVDFKSKWQLFQQEGHKTGKITLFLPNGTTKEIEYSAIALVVPHRHLVILRDITLHKQTEIALKESEAHFRLVLNSAPVGIFQTNSQGDCLFVNDRWLEMTGLSLEETMGIGWSKAIHPEDREEVFQEWYRSAQTGDRFVKEYRYQTPQGKVIWVFCNAVAIRVNEGICVLEERRRLAAHDSIITGYLGTVIDITQRHQAQDKLEQQNRLNHLLAKITRKIRQSLKLEEILPTTVTEIQKLLKCDRVLIVEFKSDNTVIPISEAVVSGLPTMLGWQIADPLLQSEYLQGYRQGNILAISDLNHPSILPEVRELLSQFAIKAKLVVPILSQDRLKGLIVAHQCTSSRQWQPEEIELLQQLADQIGVALSQAQLLNHLEELVTERTIELTATNQQLQKEIEEKQITEVALRESKQKLADILDNADEAIISIGENQTIQIFNQGAEKIFGYKSKEVLGQSLDILLPQAFRSIHRQHITDFGNSPTQGRTMEERARLVFGMRKNGQQFPAEASISKLSSKEGLIFTVMLKDITERKQAEAALRRSEEQLRLITNALPILIAYIDSEQYYRFNNQAHESWFGISCEQINGLHLENVIGTKAYQMIFPYVEKALAGHSVAFEVKLPSKNSNFRWVSANYIPDFGSSGKVKGFFATLTDISEAKRREAERKEIEQMKSEFVSVASHEIRTPLTSIHGVLQLLAAGLLGTLPEPGQEMVKIALKNTDRLVRLVNDVLDLERLESDRVVMQRQLCNLEELIQQATETIQPIAKQQNITISVVFSPISVKYATESSSIEQPQENNQSSIRLWADPDQILQTLTNLLSNAIKFSPINTTVWLLAENQGDRILFKIKDQGRGIPADKLESIFERFQQVDASDSRRKGGTGLGLAICRQIVEQHGGHIWADSTVGKGSTFYFTLPLSKHKQIQ